ncbi:glycogen-binding domain-containing protein [Candidatus Bipolaricaulota bacterium]|nr:glycogen-binding domain-containing protein [Candidatus Bipolaricaulota bacterium]
MTHDEFDILLQDTLKAEVAASAEGLIGLEAQIIEELGERRPRLRWTQWLGQLLAPTSGARLGQIAVIGATAAIFLFVGLSLSDRVIPGSLPDRTYSEREAPQMALMPLGASDRSQGVVFVWPAPPDAKTVAVVGNFNGWEGTDLSDPDGDGIWTASIPLAPGRYEYAFIVDGQWKGQDPLADEYIQSFGAFSSVRYIGRGGDGA